MQQNNKSKILIIATNHSSYPGANAVGQAHISYPSNTYIIRVPDPVLFPEDFYINSFKKGISGIIIMSSGSDCPYEGAYKRLSKRIENVYIKMKELNISTERLRLTTICTVCREAFIKEISDMERIVSK
ncbi:MAG: hydrogenase iron-sulfur subunit [Elusimicrobiales bacterium]|jgi:coenzyme F420-reducing hydrogenase delta subunit|nr:hydrogenase iron-sulfur subunit [Elusimicrobiales bacterium]